MPKVRIIPKIISNVFFIEILSCYRSGGGQTKSPPPGDLAVLHKFPCATLDTPWMMGFLCLAILQPYLKF